MFWKAYPNKAGKGAAEASWRRVMAGEKAHRGKPIPSLEHLLAGIAKWRGSRTWQEGFIPNPATWLNQRRWEDDPPPAPPSLAGRLWDEGREEVRREP